MDKNLKIVETLLDDVYELAPKLRQDDINELQALGLTPSQSLLRGFVMSEECYSIKKQNKIVAMFGVSSSNMPKGWGSIWFLGSDEMTKHPIFFVKEGRKWINKFLQKYDIIINAVDSRNISHINWITRVGLSLSNPIIINGYKFLQFYGVKNKE